MTKFNRLMVIAIMAIASFNLVAQELTFRGIYQTSRDDAYPNGEYSEYVGWSLPT